MGREYDKLVRDRIPEVIERNDEAPTTHTATAEEYERRLLDKLDEEVEEYRDTREVEELIDVLEVVHALRKTHGVTEEQLQAKREQKAERRGRFDERIVLERVEE